MPRFFFHVMHPGGLIEDEEGTWCADLESAHAEAIKSAKGIIAEFLRSGHSLSKPFSQAFVVVEELNRSQVNVPFEEAAFADGYKL